MDDEQATEDFPTNLTIVICSQCGSRKALSRMPCEICGYLVAQEDQCCFGNEAVGPAVAGERIAFKPSALLNPGPEK